MLFLFLLTDPGCEGQPRLGDATQTSRDEEEL